MNWSIFSLVCFIIVQWVYIYGMKQSQKLDAEIIKLYQEREKSDKEWRVLYKESAELDAELINLLKENIDIKEDYIARLKDYIEKLREVKNDER